MRIAHVIPQIFKFPAVKYGGIERVVEDLITYQAKEGNQITLYCAEGSEFIMENVTVTSIDNFSGNNTRNEFRQVLKVLKEQSNFDIIHFHYEPIIFQHSIQNFNINILNEFNTPIVCTFHNNTNIPDRIKKYKELTEMHQIPVAFISNTQSKPLDGVFRTCRVIHNGVNTNRYTESYERGSYLLFIGRITPEKGIEEAIQIALQSNIKLIIGAAIHDQEYFNNVIPPLIDGNKIEFRGEVDNQEKISLLKGAIATLTPIRWDEPFGLVAVESMACGTPVISFNKGGHRETIVDGETGYLVENVEEAVLAVAKLQDIQREECRAHVVNNLSSEKMSSRYIDYYSEIIKNW